ncbi:MAG: NAD(+) diphosphatase [Acidimicrobiia bacterium]|nr:NAD(+) diphosphatase [Acidimicrobiia bacterium]
MARNRFLPVVDLPDDWSGALTVVVHDGKVVVLDEHPVEVAAGAPRLLLGTLDGAACFAVDLDGDGVPDLATSDLQDLLVPLRGMYGRLDDARWTLAGRAVQLVEWDRSHRHCGRCGTPTEPAPGERARRCPACGLLARGRNFPMPMYSCLAGFVEPGETLEEAVAREVLEEVGVEVTDIRYVSSQPWPFPHSLMIGFEATWESGDIVIDEREIVDAGWFTPDDLPIVPPAMSIARTLIDRWIERRLD